MKGNDGGAGGTTRIDPALTPDRGPLHTLHVKAAAEPEPEAEAG